MLHRTPRVTTIALLMLFLAGCGQPGFDEPPPSEPTFGPVPDLVKERARDLTFTAESSWTLAPEDAWLSATPATGAAGTSTVRLQADIGGMSGSSASTDLVLNDGGTRRHTRVTVLLPDVIPPLEREIELRGQTDETVVTSVAIGNRGEAPLRVHDVHADAAWLSGHPPPGGEVAAGSIGDITVAGECPGSAVVREGTLFVEHDDPDQGDLVIDVRLECGEPAETAFGIELQYFGDGGPTTSQRQAFEAAAARWSSVIVSDLPSEFVDKEFDACETGEPEYADDVDDVLVFASIQEIDGPGGTQAMAGPCEMRADGTPLWGVMLFDEDDLDTLEQNADLETVILHEMGHVLGIGTLWDDLVEPRPCPGAGRPYYVGENAVAEWQSYGGSGDVPVEDEIGEGTDCGHWHEWELYNELMTGLLDADMRLSRITIGSLEDLGYQVDYGAADPYSLPPAGVRELADPGVRIEERLIRPGGAER